MSKDELIISIPNPDGKPLVSFATPRGIHVNMSNDERTGWGTVVFSSTDNAIEMLSLLVDRLKGQQLPVIQ